MLRFGLVATLSKNMKMKKNVDCWSAHCYALVDGKIQNVDKLKFGVSHFSLSLLTYSKLCAHSVLRVWAFY